MLKLKSLARIWDVALFTVSRCCGPYVILCRNTPTYSMSPPRPLTSPPLLHCLDCWLLSIRHPRLTLLWQKYVTCYQGSAVIPEGTRQTVKQTAVLLSTRCFSPLQIALGILPLSLSLSLSTCSSTFFRKIKKKKGWRRVRAAVVQAKSLLQEAKHLWWDGSSAVFKKMIQEMCHGHEKKKDFWG